jgi:hypothetical protein
VLLSVPVTVTLVAFVATTVKVDELPETIDVGFARMVTVGAGFEVEVTVTVAVAAAMPPVPIAAAVYMVVAIGLTVWVPPLGCRAYVMPSDPVTVTLVAFVAVTVRVDELPEVIEEGEAEIPKVGPPDVEVALPPQPANSSGSKRPGIIQE